MRRATSSRGVSWTTCYRLRWRRQSGRRTRPVPPRPITPLVPKGIGESATVGAPAAIANAVVDALWHLGVRHIDIPITPEKVWQCLRPWRDGIDRGRV